MAYLLSATLHSHPDDTFYISNFAENDRPLWTWNTEFSRSQPLRFDSFTEARKALNKVVMYAIRDNWVRKYTIELKET